MICVWIGILTSKRRRLRLDQGLRGPDRSYSLSSISRFPNPNTLRSVRVGAHGGAAGRGRAGVGANRTVYPGCMRLWYPPRHREHVVRTSPQKHEQAKSFFKPNLSIPKPGHTTSRSGRGARRGGQAESGRIECQQNCSSRKQKLPCTLQGIEETSLERLSRSTEKRNPM